MGLAIAVMIACSGFLMAVLWMDLIFDVQVLAHRDAVELPEPVLASIAGYYHRATTTSRPMGHLIAVVMAILLVALAVRTASGLDPAWLVVTSVPLAVAPVLIALGRTVPNAIRLGKRAESPTIQTKLARSICAQHILFLACKVVFLALWLFRVAVA